MCDFDEWNILKKKVNKRDRIPLIKEGDLWWCHLGMNIGIESAGKHKNFSRPVLIIKKHNRNHLIVIPTSSRPKYGKYYYKIIVEEKTSYLMLSQIRIMDTKRVISKISRVKNETLTEIKKAVYEINFQ